MSSCITVCVYTHINTCTCMRTCVCSAGTCPTIVAFSSSDCFLIVFGILSQRAWNSRVGGMTVAHIRFIHITSQTNNSSEKDSPRYKLSCNSNWQSRTTNSEASMKARPYGDDQWHRSWGWPRNIFYFHVTGNVKRCNQVPEIEASRPLAPMALFGYIRPYIAIYGHIWLCIAIYGHIWLYFEPTPFL